MASVFRAWCQQHARQSHAPKNVHQRPEGNHVTSILHRNDTETMSRRCRSHTGKSKPQRNRIESTSKPPGATSKPGQQHENRCEPCFQETFHEGPAKKLYRHSDAVCSAHRIEGSDMPQSSPQHGRQPGDGSLSGIPHNVRTTRWNSCKKKVTSGICACKSVA